MYSSKKFLAFPKEAVEKGNKYPQKKNPKISELLTFQRRLHGRLHEAGQELERLGVLGQPGREGGQGLGVLPQTLQGHAFTVIGLQQQGVSY